MKKIYSLLSVAIMALHIFVSLNAQDHPRVSEFAPLGATWYYETIENMQNDYGYVKLTVEKDTLTEGVPTRKISVTHTFRSSEKWKDLLVYQNGDSVFYYLKGRFRLVFDFGWQVGDTVTLYRSPFRPEYDLEDFPFSAKAIITEKTTEIINGHSLRRWNVAPIGDHEDSPLAAPRYPHQGGNLMEVFGFLGGFLSDANDVSDGFPNITRLLCYSDNTFERLPIEISHHDGPCDRVSLPALSDGNPPKLAVDYANHLIDITLPDPEQGTAYLYTSMGNLVMKQPFYGHRFQMTYGSLPAGIYVLNIKTKKGVYHEKLGL